MTVDRIAIDVRPRVPERDGAATAPADAPAARHPSRLGHWGDRVVGLEPWLALTCALLLLAYPNPLALPAALVGVLPSAVRLVRTGRPWRPTLFDLPLGLLLLGALLGSLASLNREAAMVRLAGLLAGLVLFAAAREHVRSERGCCALVRALLVAATVACLALLVIVAPFLLLDHVPPLALLVQALDRWEIGQRLANEDWLLQRYRFRASGVGAMAGVGLALVVATAAGTRSRRAWSVLGLLAAFFVAVLAVADNRGALLAAVLTLGALAGAWQRRLLVLVPIGVAGLALALATGLFVERGLNLRTIAQRFWFWENAVYLMRELPFTGAGLGLDSVRLTYQGYFQPAYPPFSHAHSIYLQGLLEQGLVGLAGLLGLVAATFWLGWRTGRAPERWIMAARLAGFGIATLLLTAGLSEIAALSTVGGALLLGAVGLLAATATVPAPPMASDGPPRGPRLGRWSRLGAPRVPSVLAAAGAIAAVGLVLWLTGLASRGAALVLLNWGTAELNRATLSEWVERGEQGAAAERALALLRMASGLDERDPTIQRNLALALAATDDDRRARAAVDRARALLDPSGLTARQDLFQVGRAYAEINAWGEAIRAWQSVEASPQLLQLGNRLVRSRNYAQATAAFTAAAIAQPGSRGAYEGVARVARERGGSTEEVVEALGPLIARGGDFEYMARLQVGRTYREAGRPADALRTLQELEHLATGELAFELGVVHALNERWRIAEPYLAWATTNLTSDPDLWSWLALARMRLGRHDAALATIDEGFARADLDRQADRVPLLTVRGESLLALGRPAEALAAFDAGLAIRRNDPRVRDGAELARAALAGAEPNAVANPGFAWDGGWSMRPSLPGGAERAGAMRPTIDGGVLRIAGDRPGVLPVVQEVWGLEPGATYLLSAAVRREGTGSAAATMLAVDTDGPPVALGRAATEETEWTTLEAEVRPTGASLTIVLSLREGAPNAVAAFDDVRLVRAQPGR